MTKKLKFNFSEFEHVNHLWPCFVEKLGLFKAQQAVRQAADLQRMNGDNDTIPVLLVETCGIALANIHLLHHQTGFSFYDKGMLLILSKKEKLFQLLFDA